MESLLILIPIAIVIISIAVAIFFWSVKNGQYDDLDTEGKRILFDTDSPESDARVSSASKKLDQASNRDSGESKHKSEGSSS